MKNWKDNLILVLIAVLVLSCSAWFMEFQLRRKFEREKNILETKVTVLLYGNPTE